MGRVVFKNSHVPMWTRPKKYFFLIQSSAALPGFTWAHLPKSTALCLFNNPLYTSGISAILQSTLCSAQTSRFLTVEVSDKAKSGTRGGLRFRISAFIKKKWMPCYEEHLQILFYVLANKKKMEFSKIKVFVC